MANSSVQDVVVNHQPAAPMPAGASDTTTKQERDEGDGSLLVKENGVVAHDQFQKIDDQTAEDARSDTDTSRADSVAGDGKPGEARPAKKFSTTKPVSFAKYSVPKVIAAATANAKIVGDKAPSVGATPVATTPVGRPRLVAKTTSSLQQKSAAFRPAAPDPMRVWNKNRATPQTSTKHLTDEELKQQYGIHLTSRLQSDENGKEAKWADIDDDEDDWAPETIEWNDGTKTTVTATDPVASKSTDPSKVSADDVSKPEVVKPPATTYSTSIGPNATVLKVGASVERQQAQKTMLQQSTKGPLEKAPTLSSKAAAAPTPVKSPWAKLPPIEKVPPVTINPQLDADTQSGGITPSGLPAMVHSGFAQSPAKEMSADDFTRSWRDAPNGQNRELFMPSSGRYEAVADGRRRMSRHDNNFRAPAVLQRPSQDARVPAEPSPAFQTHRTSIDQGRRRASSSISSTSGQFARRMSFKGMEPGPVIQDSRLSPVELRSLPTVTLEGSSPILQAPTYQARGGDHTVQSEGVQSEQDLEAARVAQKAAMKENIERARRRKQEEEARLEAEKQERIKAKLAALGPDPRLAKTKEAEEEASMVKDAPHLGLEGNAAGLDAPPVHSPMKPPQPLATGEPQQYGLIKVHPLDTVKRISPAGGPAAQIVQASVETQDKLNDQSSTEQKKSTSVLNGVRQTNDGERSSRPEVSPKLNKSLANLSAEARSGWGNRHDHRSPPSGNLWGLSNNKALGNGTFDHSLAGYSPQDLSRTSSSGQNWINGRTPTLGQSPQLSQATQHVPETRSHLLQSMTSPESQPLNLNSEVDSTQLGGRPAPIGPPHVHQMQPPQQHSHAFANGNQSNSGVAAWNNFHNVARVQEKTETERFQKEFRERQDEEKRKGGRVQASYNFNETFKQVQLGEQAGQRQVSSTTHSSQPSAGVFGAIGSLPQTEIPVRLPNGPVGRESRFFPSQQPGTSTPNRHAATYSYAPRSQSPSPPPAEEYTSFHPAFDGNHQRPVVHLPPEKAIVRLPPAEAILSPAPPAPVVQEPLSPPLPNTPTAPLTWAARVAAPPVRTVSTPLVQNPSWQERFNGLLGNRLLPGKQATSAKLMPPAPALSISREIIDLVPNSIGASVSLPFRDFFDLVDDSATTSKDVEDEEDLFEDREAGSLPIVSLPRTSLRSFTPDPQAAVARLHAIPVEATSAHMFMVNNWNGKQGSNRPEFAIIRTPGMAKNIKKDLGIVKASAPMSLEGPAQSRLRQMHHRHSRGTRSLKPRPLAKVH